jgi:cytoskeletal protein CcmA (bactofilin family)
MTTEESSSKESLKPSFISEGFEFIGTIKGSAPLHVGGVIKGTIHAPEINIDDMGYVEAEIDVQTALVKGAAKCTLRVDNLTVASNGKVEGLVNYKNLQIQQGGTISGEFKKEGP